MNTPGFTAEMSLCKKGEHYRMVGTPASLDWGVNRAKVKPALPSLACLIACATLPPPFDLICEFGCFGADVGSALTRFRAERDDRIIETGVPHQALSRR
jgi:hypothetical protein